MVSYADRILPALCVWSASRFALKRLIVGVVRGVRWVGASRSYFADDRWGFSRLALTSARQVFGDQR